MAARAANGRPSGYLSRMPRDVDDDAVIVVTKQTATAPRLCLS